MVLLLIEGTAGRSREKGKKATNESGSSRVPPCWFNQFPGVSAFTGSGSSESRGAGVGADEMPRSLGVKDAATSYASLDAEKSGNGCIEPEMVCSCPPADASMYERELKSPPNAVESTGKVSACSAASMLDVVGVWIIPFGRPTSRLCPKLSCPAMGESVKNCCCITGSTEAATELVERATVRSTLRAIQSLKQISVRDKVRV